MDTLIVSPESGLKSFENYNIVYTCENTHILTYERFHADMQVCVIDDAVIVPPCFYNYYKTKLKNKNVLKGLLNPFGHYPNSAAYNVAVVKNYAICNEDVADKAILERLKSLGKQIINVKQGYSKCSVCITGGGIITSDKGIYKAAEGKIPSLLISPGNISLPGCKYGFIGGASGFDGRLIFAGDITGHPDFLRIENFLREIETEYICLPGGLCDYGTLIFL